MFQISPYSIPTLIGSIAVLSCIIVIFRAKKDTAIINFNLFYICVFVWLFSYTVAYSVQNEGIAKFFAKAACTAVFLMAPFFYSFAVSYLKIDQEKKYVRLVWILVILFLPLFIFTDLFLGVRKYYWGWYSKAGPFHPLSLVIWYILISRVVYVLFRAYLNKEANPLFRQQAKYLIVSFFMAGFASADYIQKYGVEIYPLGWIFTVMSAFLIFFTIFKYRLFNIKVILTELFTFFIWLSLFTRILFAKTLKEGLLDISFFLSVLIFGILLIRSVLQEVRQKEKLQQVTFELQDLTQNLQKKVAEQTQEIRRAYEVEKKAHEELKRLDAVKDQFILITQHHLRTPLSIMKGFLSVILGLKAKIEPKVVEYVEKISASTDRLTKIVNEFLDISQFQVGKGFLKIKETNLSNLIKEILEELQPEIQKKKLFTKVIPESKDWPTIQADPEKIKQVLFNIVDNAIKYTPEGGITITCQKQADKVLLSIQDTGIGLSEEELQQLFSEVFQRGEEAQKLFTTGRGMGLFVASFIVQAHQGKIWAESEGRNQGSTFYVEVPKVPKVPKEKISV